MKNKIEYIYSSTNAIFNYLKDNDIDKLISKLKELENHSNDVLMFRFGNNNSILYSIKEIEKDLSLPNSHNNKILLLESFDIVTKDINPENEIKVY